MDEDEEDFEGGTREVESIFRSAQAIVGKAKQFIREQGGPASANITIPMVSRGSDFRVTIEAGPAIEASNAIGIAMAKAGIRPSFVAQEEQGLDEDEVLVALKDAAALIEMYADDLSFDHRQNAPDAEEKTRYSKMHQNNQVAELNDKIHKRRRK